MWCKTLDPVDNLAVVTVQNTAVVLVLVEVQKP